MGGPLNGLRIVEIGTSLTIAQCGNLFADLGAEVISIEPPAGSELRAIPGFRFLGRGKKSIALDLHNAVDADCALRLAAGADVVLASLRPKALARFAIDYESVAAVNPRAVYGSVTGWGRSGPMRDTKGYEGLIMAKIGANVAHQRMVPRPGPAFLTVPFASWSASQTLLQGVFAALRERETSGVGQLVETSLAHSLGGLDPWNQVNALLTQRYPDAFSSALPIAADGSPNSAFTYKLLVAVTKDGHWLQFSEVQPRLFDAFVRAAGFEWMKQDPEWSEFILSCINTVNIPESASAAKRFQFWDMLLAEVRNRTLAEWQAVFDDDPNVFAEVFRRGTALLHHPQLAAENQTIVLQDRRHGDVLQPGPLIRFSETPAQLGADASELDEHGTELRARAGEVELQPAPAPAAPTGLLPLSGVTILELGTFYAAPYGATVLTDLGARVIKIEVIDGDPMRKQQPFPESGAIKVLQGKESVALDLAAPESKEILQRIAKSCDLVLCSFRMGVADRLGVGADDLHRVNPQIMYLDAPGFGIRAPYGNRPAFAPTIAAGSGIAMRNAGALIPEGVPDDFDVIRARALQLQAAGGSSAAQPDGVAALAVGTALAVGAYLQSKGLGGQRMLTTMLQSCAHCLAEDMVEYAGRSQAPTADAGAHGLSALYRLYETAQGWVFLAAPSPKEWEPLVKALADQVDLSADNRFATSQSRIEHDAELAETLSLALRARTAHDWEKDLLAQDIGCVVVEDRPVEQIFMGELAESQGWLATVDSPILGEYPRLGPFNTFSRSATVATVGSTLGQHTAPVLRELGYTAEEIADLAERGVAQVG
ncbi:CaiB/BaiF CoA transferase family protein [Jatrophihabitans sp. DSM 45814]